MPGRGDNNKHGSSGRGASNQSNQPFVTGAENQTKSNHNKREETRRMEINVDMTPYILDVTPFSFNEEMRYYVSYNGSPDILFAWDNTVGHYAAFGDEAATLPDNLELKIAEKLQQMMKKDMVV